MRDGALCPEAWETLLPTGDEDRAFLLDGMRNGFRITNKKFDGVPARQKNHASATGSAHWRTVDEQIRQQIDNGRYVVTKEPPATISGLVAIPKPNSSKIRLIHDASRPQGRALNDLAVNEKFSYRTLYHATSLIERGFHLGKVDLSSAYRSVRIHPSDYDVAGLAWKFPGDDKETYMVDTRLPFRARLSAKIFNTITQAVRRIMAVGGDTQIICYLDDYLVIGKTRKQCQDTMKRLMTLLREHGFAINYNKVVGPTTRLTFLGIEINTVDYNLSLPSDKLMALQEELLATTAKRNITKRALQSLAGKLNWAAQVVYGGRPHLRRLIDKINDLRLPHHRTRITAWMSADLNWWVRFMAVFNGCIPILNKRLNTSVCIDVCTAGGGGYYDGDWYHVRWDQWEDTADLHINYKEVLALWPAAMLYGNMWHDCTGELS